jgi:hypothetical protein
MRVNAASPHPVEKVVGRVGTAGSVAVDAAGQVCGREARTAGRPPRDLRGYSTRLWTRRKSQLTAGRFFRRGDLAVPISCPSPAVSRPSPACDMPACG